MYIREPICTNLPSNPQYEIDIKLRNNTVTCKGDLNVVNRIIHSGSMFGNLVPELPKYERNNYFKENE